jgi:hypothetical protein
VDQAARLRLGVVWDGVEEVPWDAGANRWHGGMPASLLWTSPSRQPFTLNEAREGAWLLSAQQAAEPSSRRNVASSPDCIS